MAILSMVSLAQPADAVDWPTLPARDLPVAQLLDEQRSVAGSLSLGGPSGGSLQGAVWVEGDSLELLPGYAARETAWATQEAVRALRHAAEAMAECGQPTLRVGNASVRDGGAMRWSRSHQNGRDIDLAFPMVNAQGAPVLPDRLAVMGSDGVWTANRAYRIDEAATWCLVQGLIEAAGEDVQWVFVSRPLRQRILAAGLAMGASPAILERVAEVLQQPSDALPHDDHLHLRLACAPADAREGCWSWGPRWPAALDADRLVRRRLEVLVEHAAAARLDHPLADALAHGAHWRWWVRTTLSAGNEDALRRVWEVAQRRQHFGDASAVLEAAWTSESPLLPDLLEALYTWRDAEGDAWLDQRLRENDVQALVSLADPATWLRLAARRPLPGVVLQAKTLALEDRLPDATAWLTEWLGEPFDGRDANQLAWLEETGRWASDQVEHRLVWALQRWCDARQEGASCNRWRAAGDRLDTEDPRWALAIMREAPDPLLLLIDRWLVDAGLGATPRHGWDRARRLRYWSRRADARAWGEPDLPEPPARDGAD